MIDAAAEAFSVVLTVEHLIWVLAGTAIGLCIGVLPGTGGPVGMAILLPLIFGMNPYNGLALLIGMAAVTNTSDTFPSVLLGIPGSAGSQATILDGYPMARQGKAAVALGAAFCASMLGGIIGAVMLLGSIFAVTPLVLAMRTPQLFMLTLLGLCLVGVLSRGASLPGLLSGLGGLALGAIGIAPATAVYRFTFDTLYLSDGVSLVVIGLALFAIPEMVDLLVENQRIAKGAEHIKGSQFDGIKQALRHPWLITSSSAIANVIGIIPGLGASLAQWIVYAFAQQTCKNTENFGKGDVRGIIAPEAANNATEGGTLVPTLMFGIPGSPSTAILLGGLILVGVTPGPDMVTTNLPLTLSVVWTLVVANIAATAVCLALSKQIARISFVPSKTLVPFMLVFITLAATQANAHVGDILLLAGLGLVAWVMKRLSWPRVPLLMGFVLAQATERYLFRSIARYDYEWLTWPSVIALGVVTIALVLYGMRSHPVAID